jgi:uncharacterized protein RhaS with RHS repeats
LDEEHGLNWLAYGARYYDPEIGRWNVVDPADQYWSKYLGMGNTPMNGIDYDGNEFLKDSKGNIIADSNGIPILFDDPGVS